jgi:hypothetical protein
MEKGRTPEAFQAAVARGKAIREIERQEHEAHRRGGSRRS